MYVKFFASLYQGTLRGRADEILVFTNLIACCDAKGYIDKHFKSVADEVGISVERVRAAIAYLESPDQDSRSKVLGGRRLERIDDERDWGWRVVNYLKYRSIRCAEDRREQNRLAKARQRAKGKLENTANADGQQSQQCQPESAMVSQCQPKQKQKQKQMQEASIPNSVIEKDVPPFISSGGQGGSASDPNQENGKSLKSILSDQETAPANKTPKTHSDALKKATRAAFTPPEIDEVRLQAEKIGLPPIEAERFHAHHSARGWVLKGNVPMKSWAHALQTWKINFDEQRFASTTGSPGAGRAPRDRYIAGYEETAEQHRRAQAAQQAAIEANGGMPPGWGPNDNTDKTK